MSKHIKYDFTLKPNKHKETESSDKLDYASVIELNKSPYSVTGKLNPETGEIQMVIEKIIFENIVGNKQVIEELKEYISTHANKN